MQFSLLERRAVFGISGENRYSFLQGIITNDIYRLISKESNAIYGLILTPQGKLLYDVFIINKSDIFLIDCPSDYITDIISYLRRYKLHAKIKIIDYLHHRMKVAVSFQHIPVGSYGSCFYDPRNNKIGYRAIVDMTDFNQPITNAFLDEYEEKRISLLIPDIIKDFLPMQFLPAELGMDSLNAIDYRKGCYIGQEVTARIKYRGAIKKKLCLIISEDNDFKSAASKKYTKFQILGSSNNKALAIVYM